MKKLICILLTIFPIFYIYSNNINNYESEFIIQIKNGRENGQIWYDKYGLPHHTRAFTISKKENVYVCDPYNNRINIYDINLTFKKSITDKNFAKDSVAFADKIYVNDFEQLFIVEHVEGLYKYAVNGTRLMKVSSSNLPRSVLYKNHIFLLNDIIAFYNNEKLCVIDADGKITTPDINQYLNTTELIKSDNILDKKIFNYVVGKGLLYFNNKIFPKIYNDISILREEVSQEIKVLQKEIKTVTDIKLSESDNFVRQQLLGYDSDNNMYWQGYWKNYDTRVITVFSKDLILLDLFTYKLDGKEDTYEAVAPNGDIYIMQPEPDGVYFYKITRRW